MMKVTLLVPTLNELHGLKTIMPLIKKEWVDQILILDGKSTDGSYEYAKSQGWDVYQQKQKGMWNAYSEVFKSGMVKGDVVITFSPDGNSVPEAIPELIKTMNDGYDMVIASRYKGNHESPDDTFLTKIGNKVLTGMCNLKSGFQYTDALVMYRAYRTSLVKYLMMDSEPTWIQRRLISLSPLYGWESSMSIRAGKYPLKISEIYAIEPKAFRERRQNTFIHGLTIITQIAHENWFR